MRTENEFNWKLVRERDGLTMQSKAIKWLEWEVDGRYKNEHKELGQIKKSLLRRDATEDFPRVLYRGFIFTSIKRL